MLRAASCVMLVLCAGASQVGRIEDLDEGTDMFREHHAEPSSLAEQSLNLMSLVAAKSSIPSTREEVLEMLKTTAPADVVTLLDSVHTQVVTELNTFATTAQSSVQDACNACITAANGALTSDANNCNQLYTDLCSAHTSFDTARTAWMTTASSQPQSCGGSHQQCVTLGLADLADSNHAWDETKWTSETATMKSFYQNLVSNCNSNTNGFPPYQTAYDNVKTACASLNTCRTTRCSTFSTCWSTAADTTSEQANSDLTCTNLKEMDRVINYAKCLITNAENATAADMTAACGTKDDAAHDSNLTCATLVGCGSEPSCSSRQVDCNSNPTADPLISDTTYPTFDQAAAATQDVVAECAASAITSGLSTITLAHNFVGDTGAANPASGNFGTGADLPGDGWIPCYTVHDDSVVQINTELSAEVGAFGVDGYRNNCHDTKFNEVLYMNNDVNKDGITDDPEYAWFTKDDNTITYTMSGGGMNAGGSPNGNDWTAHGIATEQTWTGKYQMMMCDNNGNWPSPGIMLSGYTNCYKQCNSWCSDSSSWYFRATSRPESENTSSYALACWRENGHRLCDSGHLISVLIRCTGPNC